MSEDRKPFIYDFGDNTKELGKALKVADKEWYISDIINEKLNRNHEWEARNMSEEEIEAMELALTTKWAEIRVNRRAVKQTLGKA